MKGNISMKQEKNNKFLDPFKFRLLSSDLFLAFFQKCLPRQAMWSEQTYSALLELSQQSTLPRTLKPKAS